MKKLITTSLIAINLLFANCESDNNDTLLTPKIKIEVVNHGLEIDGNKPVNNATVLVYGSKNFEQTPIAKGITNQQGVIEFTKNIEFDKKYYVDVEKGCKNNYNTLVYGSEGDFTITAKNLEDIDLSKLKVSILETGKVILKNKSNNGYLIKILDKEIGTIAINETLTFENFPVKSSLYKLINLDNNEVLKLESLSICGDTKEYEIK